MDTNKITGDTSGKGAAYHCNWNGWWAIAAILAGAFVSPWFLVALWPLPEAWSKRLPATYTKSVKP